jgi:hypothetical protein
MSWPAGGVLVLAPALALGLQDMRWVVVLFEVAVMVALWFRAPGALRPVVFPIVIDPDLFLHSRVVASWTYLGAADALRRDRGYAGRSLVGALLLGSRRKTQPWLLAPFLAIYLNTAATRWLCARRRAFGARIGSGIPASTRRSWSGVQRLDAACAALLSGAVGPFGSGISLHADRRRRAAEGVLQRRHASACGRASCSSTPLLPQPAPHALWLAPAIIMWFGYRSLQNYYVYWIPMMLVALIAWWEEEDDAAASAPAR